MPLLPAHIILGGAKGADGLAERIAGELELPITVLKPDWRQFGRAADSIGKRDIVNSADMVIAL